MALKTMLVEMATTTIGLFLFCLVGQAVRHVYFKVLWWNRERVMVKAGY